MQVSISCDSYDLGHVLVAVVFISIIITFSTAYIDRHDREQCYYNACIVYCTQIIICAQALYLPDQPTVTILYCDSIPPELALVWILSTNIVPRFDRIIVKINVYSRQCI